MYSWYFQYLNCIFVQGSHDGSLFHLNYIPQFAVMSLNKTVVMTLITMGCIQVCESSCILHIWFI